MLGQLKGIFASEKGVLAYLTGNITLGGVHAFIQKIQPELSTALTLIQILVGLATVCHIVRKALESRKKNNEVTPPDSP